MHYCWWQTLTESRLEEMLNVKRWWTWLWLNVTVMSLSDEALLAAMRGMFCVRAFHENMMSKMRDVCAIRLRTWIEKPCGHVGLPSKTDEHGENEIRAAAQNNNSHYTGCCTG